MNMGTGFYLVSLNSGYKIVCECLDKMTGGSCMLKSQLTKVDCDNSHTNLRIH